MNDALELETPVLLLAMPQVLDPFFHKSVVLLIHHQDEGSLGFIVNRPTGIRVAEILSGLEIPWQGESETMAFFGGPVQPQLGTVIFRQTADGPIEMPESEAAESDHFKEIFPGAAMTQRTRMPIVASWTTSSEWPGWRRKRRPPTSSSV